MNNNFDKKLFIKISNYIKKNIGGVEYIILIKNN